MIHTLRSALRCLAAAGALWCALAPGAARAGGPEQPRQDGGQGAGKQSAAPPLSDEDREVIENLDLLQAMDGARDLDLLLELNKEQAE